MTALVCRHCGFVHLFWRPRDTGQHSKPQPRHRHSNLYQTSQAPVPLGQPGYKQDDAAYKAHKGGFGDAKFGAIIKKCAAYLIS